MLPQGSSAKFQEFMGMNDDQQRMTIQDVSNTRSYILIEKQG